MGKTGHKASKNPISFLFFISLIPSPRRMAREAQLAGSTESGKASCRWLLPGTGESLTFQSGQCLTNTVPEYTATGDANKGEK